MLGSRLSLRAVACRPGARAAALWCGVALRLHFRQYRTSPCHRQPRRAPQVLSKTDDWGWNMGNIVHTMTNRRYAEPCVVRSAAASPLRALWPPLPAAGLVSDERAAALGGCLLGGACARRRACERCARAHPLRVSFRPTIARRVMLSLTTRRLWETRPSPSG